jgi:hypothetical protein
MNTTDAATMLKVRDRRIPNGGEPLSAGGAGSTLVVVPREVVGGGGPGNGRWNSRP